MASLKMPSHIKKSYIVCSTGRSGSTLLCQTLSQLGFCGFPEEYFHHRITKQLGFKNNLAGFLPYFESILEKGSTSNGVFGIKMHWWQFYNFLQFARQLPEFSSKTDYEILNSFFPNPKFIYIWREDMVAQAVSTVIALQTRIWVSPLGDKSNNPLEPVQQDTRIEQKRIKFQPLKIYRWEQSFKDQNRRWVEFLTKNLNSDFYTIENKQLISCFNQEIKSIVEYLDLGDTDIPNEISMLTKSQSSTINKEFIRIYNSVPKIIWKVAARSKRLFPKKRRKSVDRKRD